MDLGTPELRLKKRLLVRGADPALSEYPLSIMLARRLIILNEHNAGMWYGGMFRRFTGRDVALGKCLLGRQQPDHFKPLPLNGKAILPLAHHSKTDRGFNFS